jgi:hypothetical protein
MLRGGRKTYSCSLRAREEIGKLEARQVNGSTAHADQSEGVRVEIHLCRCSTHPYAYEVCVCVCAKIVV